MQGKHYEITYKLQAILFKKKNIQNIFHSLTGHLPTPGLCPIHSGETSISWLCLDFYWRLILQGKNLFSSWLFLEPWGRLERGHITQGFGAMFCYCGVTAFSPKINPHTAVHLGRTSCQFRHDIDTVDQSKKNYDSITEWIKTHLWLIFKYFNV